MTFSQSGHSIIASRRFLSMYEHTNSKRIKAFQEFSVHETLTNSDVSNILNNKHLQNTCCVQNTLLVPEINLNPLYLSIRDHPICILWKNKSIYLSDHSILLMIIDDSCPPHPQLRKCWKSPVMALMFLSVYM